MIFSLDPLRSFSVYKPTFELKQKYFLFLSLHTEDVLVSAKSRINASLSFSYPIGAFGAGGVIKRKIIAYGSGQLVLEELKLYSGRVGRLWDGGLIGRGHRYTYD